MRITAGTQLDLVLGLIGRWELLDVDQPMPPGQLREVIEAAGLQTQLDLLDPALQLAAYLVHPSREPGGVPLIALVLVSRRDSSEEIHTTSSGDVEPKRLAETREVDWPDGVGTVAFREVAYVLPTGAGYEFVVRFTSPNVYAVEELDYLFDLIMASSSLVEVD